MNVTHVIIRGHVFTYEEKRPFAPSGKSILGALEYEESTDKVKCHECGDWLKTLGHHIRQHHGMDRVYYNRRHGLARKCSLSNPTIAAKRIAHSKGTARPGVGIRSPKAIQNRANVVRRKQDPQAVELQNEKCRCAAQLLFRIQALAATSGHTPGHHDLRDAGISVDAIRHRFGSINEAMHLCGLTPNSVGNGKNSVPNGFPSKAEIEKRWNERMPWPADYFQVNHRFGVPSGESA